MARHGITVNGVAPTVVRTGMGIHGLTNPVTRGQVL
jgi:NAD(P)-dependent dehydrogenase (short-subunit alcohol dehydrogenase family)